MGVSRRRLHASHSALPDVSAGGNEPLELERILAVVSDRMADISSADFLPGIEEAMRDLVKFLGYDRCTFSEFVAGDYLNILCSCATRQYTALPKGRLQFHFPWLLAQLRAGKTVVMADLPRDLPAEAKDEAQHCLSTGLRSHLSIPVRVGGRVTSVLSFASMNRARQWPSATIARLKMLGEMLGCVLALSRAEDEAVELRRRIWHADRVERVSALAAAIAHDLNQPLTAILSNAQAGLKYLARPEVSRSAIEDILEAVVREDKRAAETIRSMRSLIRKEQPRRETFELATAVDKVLLLLAGEFSAQGVNVEIACAGPCWVTANRTQIEQLCLNLALNAAAAVQRRAPGQRIIQFEISRSSQGNVVMAVHDCGHGIAPENIETIFEPFWSTRENGLGLGLAICRSIVESLGGRIWAEANAKGGATFRTELPAAGERHSSRSGAVNPALQVPESHSPANAANGAFLVGVVDDESEVRMSLLRLLEQGGRMARAYASVEQFLSAQDEFEFACLVLDVHLPGLSGRQLQDKLAHRQCRPSIVFVSANADVGTSVEAIKAGAIDFLEKPVDAEILLAAVEKAFERYEANRKQVQSLSQWKERMTKLSVRERQIMEHVVQGRLNKQIAADLLIAEQTVKQHRGRVMEKLGVRSLAELVRAFEAARMDKASGASHQIWKTSPAEETPILTSRRSRN